MADKNASDAQQTTSSPALQEAASQAQQAAANLRTRANAVKNWSRPEPVLKPDGKYRFDALPRPFTAKMQSPLSTSGKGDLVGVDAETGQPARLTTGQWGDDRAKTQTSAESPLVRGRFHAGLDFTAPVGEDVYATASGRVVEIRVQGPPGKSPRSGDYFVADEQGFIYSDKGKTQLVGTPAHQQNGVIVNSTIGFGGIYISVAHDGEYAGYTTQYMHLQETLVTKGTVTAGQLIGRVGRTGGNGGLIAAPHLHWQVRYGQNGSGGIPVRPDFFVPLWRRGSRTPPNDGSFQFVSTLLTKLDEALPRFVRERLNQGTAQSWANARNTLLGNTSRGDHTDRQAAHLESAAKYMSSQSMALLEVARFQSQFLVITDPMQYDFENGIWTDDNKAV